LGVQAEEGLGDLNGLEAGVIPEPDHLALAGTVEPMGIDGQQLAGEMAAGAPQLAQGDLEALGLLDGMGGQQMVDCLIGSDKGKPLATSKPFWLSERPWRTPVTHRAASCTNCSAS